jgi:Ca2+-binding RTX toxin-like protein
MAKIASHESNQSNVKKMIPVSAIDLDVDASASPAWIENALIENALDWSVTAARIDQGPIANAAPVIMGTAGNDTLIGTAANDSIQGLGGDDILIGGAGADVLNGGAGTDTASYVTATTGVIASLATPAINSGDAAGDTYTKIENLTGSDFSDTLVGDANDNTLIGGAGADALDGGAGVDTASYATAATGVTANLGNASVNTGDAAGDTYSNIENLTGSAFADMLTGDANDNVLDGGTGDDILDGEAGNDTLSGDAGADTLIGGAGTDTATYANATTAVIASLAASSSNTGDATGDTYSSIENLTGSSHADTLTGDANNNVLDGGAGNDKLNGGAGDDILIGGAGADTLVGGAGIDTASYISSALGVTANLNGPSFFNGDANGDTYSGIENLTGSAFDDTLSGDANNNVLDGGVGDDVLDGGAGADTLIGGAGNNTASYDSASGGVTANLANASVNIGDAAGDTYSGIQNLTGSDFNDTLTGDAGANVLDGGDGADVLVGGAGADTLIGGTGVNTASYETAASGVTASLANSSTNTGDAAGDTYSGIQNLTGSSFNDTLTGDANNNVLNGGAGADTLIGGAGNDTVTYATSTAGVVANLTTASGSGGDAAGDTYSSIENLTGGNFNDTLIGDANNNALDGAAGDDILIGGVGADTLTGGTGVNTASYETASSGVTASLANSSTNTGDAAGDTYSGIQNLTGSSFNDTLTGDANNNVLNGGAGADTLIGGAGVDTASYAGAATGVAANLAASSLNTGDAAGDTYSSIENLTGSDFNDTLTGDANGNALDGGAGDDVLIGGAGADTLIGGTGINTASYASAAAGVVANLSASSLNTGDAAGDTYSGIENLTGSGFNDTLTGDANGNVLDGGAGDDVLIGGAGADTLIGGAGVNTASYTSAATGVAVSLADSSVNTGDAFGDTYSSIENLTGGSFDDTLIGDVNSNALNGGAGNDTLIGGAGADTLIGGAGIDTASYAGAVSGVTASLADSSLNSGDAAGDIYNSIENLSGSAFDDILTGDAGNNTLTGGAGNDTLDGGVGADTLIGGVGDDTYYVDSSADAIVENANEGTDTVIVATASYTLSDNLENASAALAASTTIIGNVLDNNLTGNAGNDILIGGAGADVLSGGAGNDTASYATATAGLTASLVDPSVNTGDAAGDSYISIENLTGGDFDDTLTGDAGSNVLAGGAGNDALEGGAGDDTLTGGAGHDTLVFRPGSGHDTITDFALGQDVIELHGSIFANGSAALAAAMQSGADVVITIDAATSIVLCNVNLADLSASDFNVINEGPVAVADHLTTNEDTPLVVSVTTLTANDGSADPLTVTAVGNAAHGTVSLVDGNITFAADANFSGIAQFDYTESDEHGGTSTATVTVDVAPVADAPILTAQAGDGAPTEVGGEILVNTTTVGDQNGPAITALTNGNFVVTWRDSADDDSAASTKAQVFDAHGGKIGGEILVNTTITVSQAANIKTAITALTTGGFVVTWEDTSDSAEEIKAQIFDANGSKIGGEFLVNTATPNDQLQPAITALANGGFVVTWETLNGKLGVTIDSQISAQIFDAAGSKVGGEFTVNTTPGSEGETAITALANGGFVVTWSDIFEGVRLQIFDASGGKVGSEFLVTGDPANPAITALTNGGFVVTWDGRDSTGVDTSRNSIQAQIFDATGIAVSTEFLVNTTTEAAQLNPSITALANGAFVVTWQDLSGHTDIPDIRAQVFNATGNKVGSELLVNTIIAGGQRLPSITALANGGFAVAWEDDSGQGGDADPESIKTQIFTFAGTNEDTALPVNVAAVLTDTDGSETLALVASSIPVGATLSDGVHTFTATTGSTSVDISSWTLANLNVTLPLHFTGDLQLTFAATATDTAMLSTGVVTDSKTVTQTIDITVLPVNQAPVAVADHLTANEDTPLVLSAATLTANDTDSDGDALTVTAVGNATHGTVSLVDGNVTFMADTNFSGIAQFDYTESDGHGGTSTATVTVDVAPVADTPILTVQGAGLATKAGGALQVNTTLSGSPEFPSITTLANGDFVVTWVDQNPDGSALQKAQIFDANGAKSGSEFLVTANAVFQPCITGLSNGGFVVAWYEEQIDDGHLFSGIKVQIFDASGVRVGGELPVSSLIEPGADGMAVAALTSGEFVVTWFNPTDSGADLQMQIFDSNGTKIGSEVKVSTSGDAPEIAALATGGFVLTWQDVSDGTFKAQIFDASGSKFGDELAVSSAGGSDPSITALTNGGFVVTWSVMQIPDGVGPRVGQSDILVQILDASGSKVGDEFVADTATDGFQKFSSTTGLANGDFVVAWIDGPQRIVNAQVFNASGVKVGGEFTVGTPTLSTPSITALPAGGFVVSWAENDGPPSSSIQAQIFTLGSTNEDTPMSLSVTSALTDTDGSETLALAVSVIPVGAALSDGVHMFTATTGSTSVDISSWTLANLSVLPPLHFTGDFQLTFSATSTDTATLSTGMVSDTKTVTQTIDITVGGSPVITGTDGDDTLIGDTNPNTLIGKGGNDILIGGGGADQLIGGSGIDTASYETATSGVTVDLGDPSTNTGDAVGDTYDSIENLTGSAFNDILIGGVRGTLMGGDGADHLVGGNSGGNILDGGAADDTLEASGGNNTLLGGAGADILDGGFALNDIASYVTSTVGITASLADSSINTGDAAGDTYFAITNLAGSNFDDTLIGDVGDNTLDGGLGNDTLIGGAGSDSYMFARGGGQDRIINGVVGNTGPSGDLDLAAGISDNQVWLQRNGDDLLVSIMGSQDSVTVAGWYSSDVSQLSEIKTADGLKIDSNLSTLVQAMASYSSFHPGFDPSTVSQAPSDSGLQSAIAASWHP